MQFSSSDKFGTEKDFFKRYSEPSRSYHSLSYKTKDGLKMNRESLYIYLNNLIYNRRATDRVITDILLEAISRAKEISALITETSPELTRLSTSKNIFPNKVVLDTISEVSKESMMEYLFMNTTGTELERYKLANTIVNSFYGVAPVSVKLKLSVPYKIPVARAISDVIENRTAELYTRSTARPEVAKGMRVYTEEGEKSKLATEIVERQALNMFLNAKHKMRPILYNNMVAESVMITESIPGFIRAKFKESASGGDAVKISEDGMVNMMRYRLLTRTQFRIRNAVYRLTYPDQGTKLAMVSRRDLDTDTWTHHVFGLNDKPEVMYDWRKRKINEEELFFLKVVDTSIVMMCNDSPVMFVEIENVIIPISVVEAKQYSGLNDIEEDFGAFANKTEMGFMTNFLFDADSVIEKGLNDENVAEEDIIQLLAATPSDKTRSLCMRVVGQNMLTAYKMVVTDTAVSEEDVTFDFFGGALDDLDVEADPELDHSDIETFRNETTTVTFLRAMNSLVMVLARLLKQEKRQHKVWLVKEYLKRFTVKTVICSIVLSLY
jgi:hypothetical protein